MMPESPLEDRRTSSPRCQLLLEIVLPSCFTQGHVLLRGGSPHPVTTDSKSKCLSFWLSRRTVLKGPLSVTAVHRVTRGVSLRLHHSPACPPPNSASFPLLFRGLNPNVPCELISVLDAAAAGVHDRGAAADSFWGIPVVGQDASLGWLLYRECWH